MAVADQVAQEQVTWNRLVEQDEVLGMFGTLGTPTNAAAQKYLNERKVPQFLVFSGVARFRDPKTFPWTVGADLDFRAHRRIHGLVGHA